MDINVEGKMPQLGFELTQQYSSSHEDELAALSRSAPRNSVHILEALGYGQNAAVPVETAGGSVEQHSPKTQFPHTASMKQL